MAGFRDREKQHFPLTSIQDVVNLFSDQLERGDEVDLALLSIVLGCIENTLTMNRSLHSNVDESKTITPIFPVVEADTIEALHVKFTSLIKKSVDLTKFNKDYASRDLVKRVSDVIWGSLTRAYYKDKAHLQSLYSFLTGNKLDCFGVAFAVVAACQVLGFQDVKLSLSEDHAWVVFGKDSSETAEVTWHGKGNEDKRGQPITEAVADKAWLYLNGHPVVCTRQMEVAAIVSSINPAISASIDSIEMGSLQQELLYLLYQKGYLSRYPMAIGNLGDLEEISPNPEHPTPIQLFQEGVEVARTHYNNQHVYPYTYLGGFLYRCKQFPQAINAWAQAASVIKGYNYTREDEEVYKEFLEIANEFIPNIVKASSKDGESASSGDPPLLQNPAVYADLLHFYDGICEWEEGSSTPVLHVGWAQQFTFSLSKFDPRVRSLLDIHAENEEDEEDEGEEKDDKQSDKNGPEKEKATSRKPSVVEKDSGQRTRRGRKKSQAAGGVRGVIGARGKAARVRESKTEEAQIKSAMEELVSKVGGGEDRGGDSPNPSIAALAQACSSSILNKDFLLSGGEPFAATTSTTPNPSSSAPPTTTAGFSAKDTGDEFDEFLSSKSNGTSFIGLSLDSMLKAESPADMMLCGKRSDAVHALPSESDLFAMQEHVALELRSEKMKGLKKILMSTKLNANAIKLQLTAQSQVQPKHAKRGAEADSAGSLRKRTRRE
ncbi:LOW QUALITY PROTEIN: menin-like [Babylonia areolata]|uniref:LOW QUALITY PROTEIN: menin-like n=1 Tax=Babylonia areolata TaxID=304850 RepID=UPI003FD61800